MKILVTGGAGFIGANLVRILSSEGHQVRVYDNLVAGSPQYLAGLDLEFITGDVRDQLLTREALQGMDAVVHLAAQTGVPGSLQDPQYDCDVNVFGTLNLLEACRISGVPQFVFASSNAPLGRQDPPAREDKAPLPVSPYGASKLAGEGYCLAYNGSWGIRTTVLRFANVYGRYSSHKNSVVAKFMKDIIKTGKIAIDGDGRQTRDFIYASDLCRAIPLALTRDIGGEVFQIATGVEVSILEIAAMIQQISDSAIEIRHQPSRQGDIRKNFTSITKARNVLGWQPEIELSRGLTETWKWFKAQ
jgi:UDP-glucose 4-epimerase